MAVKIKICGVRTPAIADAVVEAGADYIGMVFYPPSPRNISPKDAALLVKHIDGHLPTVAVLVDPDDAALDDIVSTVGPAYLQLHGNESPERVAAIKVRSELPVIKAVRVANEQDVEAASTYAEIADMILFDTKPSGDKPLLGGSGVPFDWTLLSGKDVSRPFGLSGGLDAANVAEAIAVAKPDLVDVSSGVESAPGVKDAAKIGAFVTAARKAEAVLDAEQERAEASQSA